MRVCARRKSLERDNAKNEYKIEYNVYSKIGFSFTHKRYNNFLVHLIIEKVKLILGFI